MKNLESFFQKWGGNMKKLWMQALANIKKTKSVSATLICMFIIAAFLLNTGLLVIINYGSFFGEIKEELAATDAYYFLPETLYKIGRAHV